MGASLSLSLSCLILGLEPASARSPAEDVAARFGGVERLRSLERLELGGVVEAARPIEFRLRIRGRSGRLDVGSHSRIDDGVRRGLAAGGARRAERAVSAGWENTRLVPFGLVLELAEGDFRHRGREGTAERFEARRPRGGFLGYDPEPVEFDLWVVDGLPVRLRVRTPGVSDRPVEIAWEDYRTIDDLPVPHTVRRRSGSSPAEVFRVLRVDLEADFPDAELSLSAGGGR